MHIKSLRMSEHEGLFKDGLHWGYFMCVHTLWCLTPLHPIYHWLKISVYVSACVCYDTVGDIDLLPGEVFHAGAMWICLLQVSQGT